MLNPARALSLSSESGKLLPHVDELQPLYDYGVNFRHGQVIMIAGRSGSQKSGFAMWLADELGLSTLYLSADMAAFTASARLASKRTGLTTEEVESALEAGGKERDEIFEALEGNQFTFSFGNPITWRQIDNELDAAVELNNAYPQIICVDNLMDFEGADSDYSAQMEVFQGLTAMARDTGATVIVMHHASDKTKDARLDPSSPPSRDQIKNGLSEKPELTLSVALDPVTLYFNIAVVKQRTGKQDPSARRWVSLKAEPEYTRFRRLSRVS